MKSKVSIGEILYFIFWILMLMAKGLGFYEGMTSYNVCLLIAFSCVMIKILNERHNVCELFVIMGLLALGVIVYISSREKAPLIYILMILGIKNISVKRVFKIGLIVWSVCFGLRALLEITGISLGLVLVHEKLGMGPIIRWSFGYPHPNVLQISYAVLAAFILYLSSKKGKEQIKLLLFLLLGNLYVFLYSVSYTGVILTALCLIIFYYFDNKKKFGRFEKIVIQCVLPFCFIFSIAGPILTGEGMLFEKLDPLINKVLNVRFVASRIYLNFGIGLFGKSPSQLDTGYALDSSYVTLLMRDGLVVFILVFIGYWKMIKYYINSGKRKELAIILSFLIAGISEPFLFNTSFKNLSFLFMGNYLYEMIDKLSLRLNIIGEKRGKSWAEKEFELLTINWNWFFNLARKCWGKNKKAIITVSIVIGIICGAAYKLTVTIPDKIYVGVGNTDWGKREEIYLDRENLPDNFDGTIYEYQGKDYPMYEFSGNIVKMEIVRGIVSWGGIGFIGGIFLILLPDMFWTGWRKEKDYKFQEK